MHRFSFATGAPAARRIKLWAMCMPLSLCACEQVTASNNGEERRLQFEPGNRQVMAVGLGGAFEIEAADPDGETCLAVASDCVPPRLSPVEVRQATCLERRCRTRVDGSDRVVVFGERAGGDLLQVEACFTELGCVIDRFQVEFASVGEIRIDCLDDACPGSSTGVLVGSRVRTRIRLYGGGVAEAAQDREYRVPDGLRRALWSGELPLGPVQTREARAVVLPFELRATEGLDVSTEGDVRLDVDRQSGLDLVLRPNQSGEAVLVTSVDDTRQRFAFDVVSDATVTGLHLRVAGAIGFVGELPSDLPSNTSLVIEGALDSRLQLVPIARNPDGNDVVGGADRFRSTDDSIARIDRDDSNDTRFELIVVRRGQFELEATMASRVYRWTFTVR